MAVQFESFCKPFVLDPYPGMTFKLVCHLSTGEHGSVADVLQILSETLDKDGFWAAPLANVQISLTRSKSTLIKDCMWNGSNYEHSSDFKVLARSVNTAALYETPCSTPPPVEYVSSDCVDPSTVFPYPVNKSHQTFCTSSDSEEKIDVVTIEKPMRQKQHNIRPRGGLRKQQSLRHKLLERKRRDVFKNIFNGLREEVPDLTEQTPRITILLKAKDFIDKLRKDETRLLTKLSKERRRNEELLSRVCALEQKRQ